MLNVKFNKMYSKRLLIISFMVINVDSGSDKHRTRKGRTFSFNAENDDIRIDLDFSIPFLSIPVKKTLDSLDFPTININPASLALGGAVVLGATILLPFLVKDYSQHHSYRRYSRILDNVEFETDAFLNFASKMTNDNHSLRACAMRIACWSAQKNYSESLKHLSHILSNQLFSNVINSTALEDAMLSGINGRDCMTYSPCSLNEHLISNIMSYLVSNT